MECVFTYDRRETVRAVATFRRLHFTSTVLWIGGAWTLFGIMFAWQLTSDLTPTTANPNPTLTASLADVAPVLFVPVLLTVYFFTPLWGYTTALIFRRSPLYNREVTYRFEENGFTLQSALMSQSASWEAIGKAGESRDGFILFWGKSKRSFHWLPKHGFASEPDIAACRELIRKSVANFKSVG